MMDQFVNDITELWTDVGLELKPRNYSTGESEKSKSSIPAKVDKARLCPEGGITCEYCKKPVLFEKLEAREKIDPGYFANDVMLRKVTPHCHKRNCPQMVTSAA